MGEEFYPNLFIAPDRGARLADIVLVRSMETDEWKP